MYIIKSKNFKPIAVPKAQDKKDAIEKAQNAFHVTLVNPTVKFYDNKKKADDFFNSEEKKIDVHS